MPPDDGRRPRPLVRRDAEGIAQSASSWESLTERLIREAQDRGAFDDLPGQGLPLPATDDTLAGDMALAFHVLRNSGAAPPWIEADKAIRRNLARFEAVLDEARVAGPRSAARLERELDALAAAHDAAVVQLETLAPTPRQHRRRLDRAALRARLTAALEGRTP